MSHISVFIVDRLHETSLFLFFNMRKVQGGAGKVSGTARSVLVERQNNIF